MTLTKPQARALLNVRANGFAYAASSAVTRRLQHEGLIEQAYDGAAQVPGKFTLTEKGRAMCEEILPVEWEADQ